MDRKHVGGVIFTEAPEYSAITNDRTMDGKATMRRCMEELERIGEPMSLPKNQVIMRAGKVPEHCFLVKSGQVVGAVDTEQGNELFCFLMGPNSLLGEGNVLFQQVLPITFRTCEPTVLFRIEKKDLEQLLHSNNEITLAFYQYMANKFFAAMEEVKKTKSRNATWRLCDLLEDFAEQYGVNYDGKMLIQKKLSIDMLTSILGVNRATTVRAIRALRDLNLIETINGYYCIRDMERLKIHQEAMDYI